MGVRLFYMDDSGTVQTGFITYSWVELEVADWNDCLREWIAWRRDLSTRTQIPTSYELHMSDFFNGRGTPSLDAQWNASKANRAAVVEEGLAKLATLGQVHVGTSYRQTQLVGKAYGAERLAVYEATINTLNARLSAAGDVGLIIMDGDGSDSSYRKAHRRLKLTTRAIIEDPSFQGAHNSQFVQMADMVGYATYQHLVRSPSKTFMWPWYSKHLAARCVGGGPQVV